MFGCLFSVLSADIKSYRPLDVHPGAECCFMDWAAALPGKLLSSPKWELWLDQQCHARSCDLAAADLCAVFSALVQYGLAWFWFVPACCDHISNTYRSYWGNRQIYLTQQHIALVMIFQKSTGTHAYTLFFLDFIVHCTSLLTGRCTPCSCRLTECHTVHTTHTHHTLPTTHISFFFFSFDVCSWFRRAAVVHASEFNPQAPWWSRQSYSALGSYAGVRSADPAVRPVPMELQAMT